MTELIIVAMALALLQTLLPTMLNTKNLAYLASNRDKDVEFAPVVKRLKNAERMRLLLLEDQIILIRLIMS